MHLNEGPVRAVKKEVIQTNGPYKVLLPWEKIPEFTFEQLKCLHSNLTELDVK